MRGSLVSRHSGYKKFMTMITTDFSIPHTDEILAVLAQAMHVTELTGSGRSGTLKCSCNSAILLVLLQKKGDDSLNKQCMCVLHLQT
jgi:hypothetical protein